MNASDIEQLIQSQLPTCEVSVTGDGSHFNIEVKDARFEGLSRVKQQQLVYACLNEKIADGSIHAVNIKTVV